MTNHYLAFTIGPIYRTMDGARYTRELWASSYLFSYLVKDIIWRVRTTMPDGQFIVPAVVGGLDELFKPATERTKDAHGAGLFPDRFIVQVDKPGYLPILAELFDETLTDVAAGTFRKIKNKSKKSKEEVKDFLADYLQLYALEMPVDSERNIIKIIMPHLDTLELQRRFPATDESYLRDLFDGATNSFLVEDAFGGKHSFETILEVAARDFDDLDVYQKIGRKRTGRSLKPIPFAQAIQPVPVADADEPQTEPDSISEEQDLLAYLAKHQAASLVPTPARIFRPAHKYIAVVQADGDNVGKVIGQLRGERYQAFSKELGDFALEAAATVADYGGMNIYAGGDDLLFFAPVLRQRVVDGKPEHQTIFDLLTNLDNQFRNAFNAKKFPVGEGEISPTLSFGVSITYYKFPLYEARQSAAHQLFGVAKGTDGKNTIGLRVQKHSGQPFAGAFQIKKNSFAHLTKLLRTSLNHNDLTLTSVVHKIWESEFLLRQIGPDQAALQAFFDNSFNEAIHRDEAKPFLDTVVLLLHDCFTEHPNQPDVAIKLAYALLRVHGFLTSTDLS